MARNATKTANETSNEQGEGQSEGQVNEQSSEVQTIAREIGDIVVNLPLRFKAGDVMTANQALILYMAHVRQYTNNKEAAQKALEKAGKPLLTKEQLEADFISYEPDVKLFGGTGANEKMREDAAWRALVEFFNEHNELVKAGGEGIAKAKGQPVELPKGKGSAEVKSAMIAKCLDGKVFGFDMARFERHLEAIKAEKGSKPEKSENTVKVNADAI